jgi:hypothetical protein
MRSDTDVEGEFTFGAAHGSNDSQRIRRRSVASIILYN